MKKWSGFAAGVLAGGLLMTAIPSVSGAVQQYLLVKAPYPVHVNSNLYVNQGAPILNYQGITYVPLRAIGDLLGADVAWNAQQRIVEIQTTQQNSAFRKIGVTGTKGTYTVTGEARVFEANMNYAVSDGHRYLLEKNHTLKEGAPSWSAFKLDIKIAAAQLPVNGVLMLELFEYSAKDGSRVNVLSIPLEKFPS